MIPGVRVSYSCHNAIGCQLGAFLHKCFSCPLLLYQLQIVQALFRNYMSRNRHAPLHDPIKATCSVCIHNPKVSILETTTASVMVTDFQKDLQDGLKKPTRGLLVFYSKTQGAIQNASVFGRPEARFRERMATGNGH